MFVHGVLYNGYRTVVIERRQPEVTVNPYPVDGGDIDRCLKCLQSCNNQYPIRLQYHLKSILFKDHDEGQIISIRVDVRIIK